MATRSCDAEMRPWRTSLLIRCLAGLNFPLSFSNGQWLHYLVMTLFVNHRTLPALKMKITHLASLSLTFGLLEVVGSSIVITTSAATLTALANGAAAAGVILLGASLGAALVGGRDKRQAPECITVGDPDMLFNLAVSGDNTGCSQRFVCEIAARDVNALSEEEKLIRSVFTSNNTTDIAQENSGRDLLIQAAALGLGNELAICASTFDKCPFDSKTLLRQVQQIISK